MYGKREGSHLHKTQLVEINIKSLFPAKWNYKTDGTSEQIEKLCNSIKEDKSAGVIAVREMNGGFEVIDGNHRLKAVKKLRWKVVPCENFGEISKAKAITIARRRNHKWFEDDVLAYAEIFKDDVLEEFTIDQLEGFMPESKEELNDISKLLEFDWSQYDDNHEYSDDIKTVSIKINDDVYSSWLRWREQCKAILEYDSDARCFELAIIEALNTPMESYTT